MRTLIALALMAALGACATDDQLQKPDLPGTGPAAEPKVVIVEKLVYVPIPASITRPEPIAEGPINQCFQVAAERRAALERANAKLAQCAAVHGTEVVP